MLLQNVLHNGQICDILIQGNTIVQISTKIDITGEKILDCSGKAILPSFANTHTHASMMFLRGVGEDKPLFDWLNDSIWPLEAKLKPEHIYPLSRFAILEMIKTGTTFFCDMYSDPDETIKAVQDMGIRAMIPYVGAMDVFNTNEYPRRLEKATKYMSNKSPCTRVIKGLSCHAIYTTSEKMIRKFYNMAQEQNTYFHIHISETQKEVDDCINQFGCRPVELLHKWGVLGPKTILAHAVHLNDDEIKIIAKTQSVIAHCPTSNLKLNSGAMDLQKYLDEGLNITLGTDSVSSNNSLSMISEMKFAALSAKSVANNSTAGKVDDIFHISTRNGFQAFNINTGKIEEGALADFILVDLNNPFLMPNTNLKSNMIYAADSLCITDVFCDGKQIMTNGRVQDEEDIRSCFKEVCAELMNG
jgi:5-methylthioadenosine/S-adenosylhomocysteine deaminase